MTKEAGKKRKNISATLNGSIESPPTPRKVRAGREGQSKETERKRLEAIGKRKKSQS